MSESDTQLRAVAQLLPCKALWEWGGEEKQRELGRDVVVAGVWLLSGLRGRELCFVHVCCDACDVLLLKQLPGAH